MKQRTDKEKLAKLIKFRKARDAMSSVMRAYRDGELKDSKGNDVKDIRIAKDIAIKSLKIT
jgi:hypothetical protein